MLISWVAAGESLLKLSCACLQNEDLRMVTEPSLQHTVRRQENMEASKASLCPSQGGPKVSPHGSYGDVSSLSIF